MHRDVVEVIVEAFEGGVPMFRATSAQVRGLDLWLYQRDDGAWLSVFPDHAAAIARPRRSGDIDLPAAVAQAFPELVL